MKNQKIIKILLDQINCVYKNEMHSLDEIKILGDNFEKNSIFEIYIDGKKIKFTKTYKFSDYEEHKIEYHLFEEINMKKMFQNISSLISVEMISIKNCKILSMIGTFENCINLESFKIEGFNVENIKSLEKTFYNTKIKEIDLNVFNNIQIEDISYMLALSPIKYFNFSKFDFSNIKNMSHLFESCSSLEEIIIPSIIILDKLEDMSYMFRGCESLVSLDLSNFMQTNNLKDMPHLFQDSILLNSLDLSNLNTKIVKDMSFMFEGCSSLQIIDITNFETINVEYMKNMFKLCNSLIEIKTDINKFITINVINMS